MNKNFKLIVLTIAIAFSFLLSACGSEDISKTAIGSNPASDGFQSAMSFVCDNGGSDDLCTGTINK